MVEDKVVLAMTVRRFAFEKLGLTGRNGEEEVYNSMAGRECAVRWDEGRR